MKHQGLIGIALAAWMLPLSAPAIKPPRDPAPRFKARSLEGKNFTNESVKGKLVLLQFWTTWCGNCRRDESAVDELTREHSDRGLVVLAVNVGESRRTVEQYLARSPRSCHIILMEHTNLAAVFQANAFPLYVVIDREGKVAGDQRGAGGIEPLRQMLMKAGLE